MKHVLCRCVLVMLLFSVHPKTECSFKISDTTSAVVLVVLLGNKTFTELF